ncbi:regulator of DNA class I crossover intermediates 1 [Acridotheres tristis]
MASDQMPEIWTEALLFCKCTAQDKAWKMSKSNLVQYRRNSVSRSRIILKQERRKQKEYFERKKLKSKMKLLDVSSPKSSAVSLDLLNLYVVNQISTKKDNTENMRKPIHIDITEDEKKPIRRHNLELPTSPLRKQHKSNLEDLQSRLQKQVMDSRRQYLSEKVKYQHNLSQVMELGYVDSSMGNEDNMARVFSACPLSSGFQFSNPTQLSEEHFNTNLMSNIWEQPYEKKLQNQSGNSFDQNPWNTKSSSQVIFRKSDTMPQELFKLPDRPDNMNSARKNPVIIASNESENREGIKEQVFDIVKETAELKGPQDGSGYSFLSLFEDESQPIHNNPSTKHFNPFSNQSNTDIFATVPDVRNQITNKNYSYDTGRVYPAINTKENSIDRHLEGVFTAPEQVFLKSNNVLSTSYKETSGLHKTHLQNCHDGQQYFTPCGKKEKGANLEKIGIFAYHHDRQNSLKENVQNYSRKKCDDKYVKETAWNQNHLFIFEEFTTAHEKGYKFGVSSYLHEMEMDVESPLSSHFHSYSPRQTESFLSSSPDTSEAEDTAKTKEYLNEQFLKAHDANLFSASASRETPKSSQTQSVAMKPSSFLAREEANNFQEKDSNFCATEEENKASRALSQGPSHKALKREHVTHSTRCDVWSQTEGSVTEVEKVDVGTQCGTLRVCSCGGCLPPARSPGELGSCPATQPAAAPPSTASTAGEHERPGQEVPQPAGTASAAGTDAFFSEAEYLCLAGRRTLEVLSYIDKMKERDKL